MTDYEIWFAAKMQYAETRQKGEPLWHQLTPEQRQELYRQAKAAHSAPAPE